MTKKYFVPTIASISICSLTLCNCATISNYRKDPSEWNTPGATKPAAKPSVKVKAKEMKEEQVKKVAKKSADKKQGGGLFGFITKYRQDPKYWNQTESTAKPATATALANKPVVSAPKPARVSAPRPSVSQPRYVNQPRIEDIPTLPTEEITRTTQKGVKKERRQVGQLLAPDADKLPTKEDLQEIQSILPNSGNSNGVQIPIKP